MTGTEEVMAQRVVLPVLAALIGISSANVTGNPVTRADLVLEFHTGERVNKDGERGVSSQLQVGWKVRF